jgi:hypothetical protein
MDQAGDFVVSWRQSYVNSTGGTNPQWGSVYADVFYASGGSTGPMDEVPANIEYGAGPNGTSIVNSAVVPYEVPAVVAQPAGGGAFDLAWAALSQVCDNNTGAWTSQQYVYAEQFSASGAPNSQGVVTVYQTQPNPGGNAIIGYPSAAVDANNDLLVVYSLPSNDTPPTGYTSANGEVFAQFYLDPPAASASPTPSSGSTASPIGSSSAATDAVFAAYAYPEDDVL